MKKIYIIAILIFTSWCNRSMGQPTITSFAPISGDVGTSVIITGSNFNTSPSNNIVYFGATMATVSSASSTSITVTVPACATYQYISVSDISTNLTGYSNSPFIVTFPSMGGIDVASFASKLDFTTGTDPRGISIADLDGDGKSDLPVANFLSNSVSVFLNNGSSGTVSFAPKVDFPIGSSPSCVKTADLDGDGKPELITACTNSDKISVLLNTSIIGSISFSSAINFTTGTYCYNVSIGDLDGDGKPDLAAVNYSSNTVSIYKNTSTPGAISFAAKVDYSTGTNPSDISIGDLDGDGKPDLAIANRNSNTVSVLQNTSITGTISFLPKVDFVTGSSPFNSSMGDLDGDGKIDLAVSNSVSNTVSVFRNSSIIGAISFNSKVDYTTGSAPYHVSIGDIDGDAKPDFAIANSTSNTVSLLINNSISGSISFATKVDYLTGVHPHNVYIGDVDGDGKPDLATPNEGTSSSGTTISILRNLQCTPGMQITSFIPASGPVGTVVTITGANFNSLVSNNSVFFGATKAMVSSASSTSIIVTVPAGTTYQTISVTDLSTNLTTYSNSPFIASFPYCNLIDGLSFSPKTDFTTGTDPRSISISDLDGDGKSELSVANFLSNSVSVFLNTGTNGIVSFATKIDFSTGGEPSCVKTGDLDGDGKSDLVTANTNSDKVSVFLNTSTTGNISFGPRIDLTAGSYCYSVSIGDFDGDGKPDLAAVNYSSNTISIYKNTSTIGSISFAAKVDYATGTNPSDISIGDLDGDGMPDLAIANRNSNTVSIFKNSSTCGTISFLPKVDYATGSSAFSVSMGDLDGDGKTDVAVSNAVSNTVSVLRNTSTSGTISLASKIDFTTGLAPYHVSIGDMDGDGKPDLAIANSTSYTVSILTNSSISGTISFAPKVDYATGVHPHNVYIGDLDGDGKPDLVTPNEGTSSSGTTISILRNQLICSITIASPAEGSAINNRCDFKFCVLDSLGGVSPNNPVYLTNSNILGGESFQTLPYNIGSPGVLSNFCLTNSNYSFAPGIHKFYLWHSIFGVIDSVSLDIINPITDLCSELAFSRSPLPGAAFDFKVTGLDSAETYTIHLHSFNGPSVDSIVISGLDSVTLSHQYPHNGVYYPVLSVTSSCGNYCDDSTGTSINITNGCDSYSSITTGGFQNPIICSSDSASFSAVINYVNLSVFDTSSVIINWGDGITETYLIPTDTSGDDTITIIRNHLYISPGVYTLLLNFYNDSACYNDSLITTINVNVCGNLSGLVYNDANNNCNLTTGETGMEGIAIKLSDGNNTYIAWTDTSGNYLFSMLPAGSYTIQIVNLNQGYNITCSSSLPHTINITGGNTIEDFAVYCNGFDIAVTGVSLLNGLFPGQTDAILPHIGIFNNDCNMALPAQVKLILSPCLTYTAICPWGNTHPAPTNIIQAGTGDTLIWDVNDINDIGTFNYYDYFTHIITCTSAQVGDTACVTVIVLPTDGDADSSNNTFKGCTEIGVSFDPNEKNVSPKGYGIEGYIPASTLELTYTLNFQNTGTAKAYNIYVLDTINANLDINTIEIVSSSHQMQPYLLPNRTMKFMFANIMLADSTHDEEHSHGYVTYRIKPNNGLAMGTQIKNTGYIYFDYNAPIATNTTITTIEINTGISEAKKGNLLKVYPNPANSTLIISISKTSSSSNMIVITDLPGRVVKEIRTNELTTEMDISDLQSGIYFIKLIQDNESFVQKIIIQK